jgi:hypothetical protein
MMFRIKSRYIPEPLAFHDGRSVVYEVGSYVKFLTRGLMDERDMV